MKHYDYIEWVFYKKNLLSEEKAMKMEKHLYNCDRCMDIFLSLIDDREIGGAEEVLSSDFTKDTMTKVENIKHMGKPPKSNMEFRETFTYYVAVASVAIVLTIGGFYSGLVDMVPSATQSAIIEKRINLPTKVVDISGKIVSRTSDFINNIERANIKEDLR